MPNYLIEEYKQMEERIKRESDLLQWANDMGGDGGGMFLSVVQMKDDYYTMYFAMNEDNQKLRDQLDWVIRDGDLVKAYYQEKGIDDSTQVTKSHLVLEL